MIRTTFRNIKASYPDFEMKIALACSMKVMNDTLGPELLANLALVFCELPQNKPPSDKRPSRLSVTERA